MKDLIVSNKEWVFSGIGVFILGIIINFLFNNDKGDTYQQESDDDSINIQAVNSKKDINITINSKQEREEKEDAK